MNAVRLRQRFLEKVWGSYSLAPLYSDTDKKIGEVWFEADEPLPLLLKFIFTTEKLSVQVHPDDVYAASHESSRGKTEMWHVVHADPGASLALGFREDIGKQRLRESALTGEIEQLLEWHPVSAGDTFFVPAGTVHAIGAGLVVAEIQQQSDITYRLYDYGRPRELHLDKGVEVSQTGSHPGKQDLPVSCPYFSTEGWNVANRAELPAGEQFLMFLEGHGSIGGEPFEAGEAWKIPANAGVIAIDPAGPVRFLSTRVP